MRYIIPRIFASIYCRISSGNWKKNDCQSCRTLPAHLVLYPGNASTIRVLPEPNLLVLFPPDMPHEALKLRTEVQDTILHPKEMEPFSIMFENHSKSNLFQYVPMGMFACSIEFDRARRGLVFEKPFWTSRFFPSFLLTRWNNQMLALKREFPLRDWDARHVKMFIF